MINELKLPDLTEKLEFGNEEHINIKNARELINKLQKEKLYNKWRNEVEFYDYVLSLMNQFKVDHLSDKFEGRLYELIDLIDCRENRVCDILEIPQSTIKFINNL